MANSYKEGFKVIIVGGGIAGLTLANALKAADIDFFILEARGDIAPKLGASIGIAPNGNRILDQLSCYDELERMTVPVTTVGNHDFAGKSYGPRTDMFQLGHVRMNYPICFLERRDLLRILAKPISCTDRLQLNRRVKSIEHFDDHVSVHCTDGTIVNGNIVVGADGLHSKVRQEMWRTADTCEPGLFSDDEKACMYADFKCLYGLSNPIPGINAGSFDVALSQDLSLMTIVGKAGTIFWFLSARLPEKCSAATMPKYNQADAEKFAVQHLGIPVNPNMATFGDLWKNRIQCTLTPLEEADYDHWTWGRFVCVGDGIHKMTPQSGAGGNNSMESAAALANALYSLKKITPRPSTDEIQKSMHQYEKDRKFRVTRSILNAHLLTRIYTLSGPTEQIVANIGLRFAGDLLADVGTDEWLGAHKIDYLPAPKRSLGGTMPFNPSQGGGRAESLVRRTILALPLLAISAFYLFKTTTLHPLDQVQNISYSGMIPWHDARSIPVITSLFGIRFSEVDWQFGSLLIDSSVVPIDGSSSYQKLTFLADFGLVYAIMLIEGTRRANIFKPTFFPFVFGLLVTYGIGAMVPVYFFLFYVLSPIATFAALDKRLTNRAFTLTVLPVLGISYYAPLFTAYYASSYNTRHAAVWILHLFPAWTLLGQQVLARTIMPQTVNVDKMQNPRRDLYAIRVTIGIFTLLSATIWISVLLSGFSKGFSIAETFLPNQDLEGYLGGVRNMLVWDQLLFNLASLLGMFYLFTDMKAAGMVQQSWAFILPASAALVFLTGAGATTGALWLWREETLAWKRHKDAVVKS